MSKKDCKEGVVINKKEADTLLKQVCKKYGVDADSVFQYSCATRPVQKVYKHSTSHRKRLDTHLFAIKFFPDDNVYVAWNLWEGARGTTNFSVKKEKVNPVPGQIAKILANTEYSGRGTRIVYAFEPDCLDEFVRRYVAHAKAQRI